MYIFDFNKFNNFLFYLKNINYLINNNNLYIININHFIILNNFIYLY